MRFIADLLAGLVLLLLSPIWLVRLARRGTLRTDWPGRLGFGRRLPGKTNPRILIHAVSVGETAAIEPLVERLRGDSGGDPLDVAISVTTDTGVARATQLYGDRHAILRTPFAFHRSVASWLDRVRPDVLVLVELEVWPSMVAAARRRGIPVVVVNGRLTERSHRRYMQIRPLVARAFAGLAAAGVQDEPTGERFAAAGVPGDRIEVTGTMKWDRAVITDRVDGADELAAALGIDPGRPLVVAGSTSPEETPLLHEAVGHDAQLLCAPRRPEWFDRAADDMPGCGRRSKGTRGTDSGRFLLDTIGELRAAYALADVVVVGRSFGNLHGSDMMEPVGLGRPVVIGPRTGDFAGAMDALRGGDGIVETDVDGLRPALLELLGSEQRRSELAERGRAVIRRMQGASDRSEAIIRRTLASRAR